MKIDFNLKGAERKELVKAISRITGINAEYQGTPSMSYQIGDFTVTKDGALVYDDKVDASGLLNELSEAGFEGITDQSEGKELKVPEPNVLTIEIPVDKVNTGNLQKLLDAKGHSSARHSGLTALPLKYKRTEFPSHGSSIPMPTMPWPTHSSLPPSAK